MENFLNLLSYLCEKKNKSVSVIWSFDSLWVSWLYTYFRDDVAQQSTDSNTSRYQTLLETVSALILRLGFSCFVKCMNRCCIADHLPCRPFPGRSRKICNIADLPPDDLQHCRPSPGWSATLQTFPQGLQHCRSSPFHCRPSPFL